MRFRCQPRLPRRRRILERVGAGIHLEKSTAMTALYSQYVSAPDMISSPLYLGEYLAHPVLRFGLGSSLPINKSTLWSTYPLTGYCSHNIVLAFALMQEKNNTPWS